MIRTAEKLLAQLRGETNKARADLAALPGAAADSGELAGAVLAIRDSLAAIRQACLRLEAAGSGQGCRLPTHLREVPA